MSEQKKSVGPAIKGVLVGILSPFHYIAALFGSAAGGAAVAESLGASAAGKFAAYMVLFTTWGGTILILLGAILAIVGTVMAFANKSTVVLGRITKVCGVFVILIALYVLIVCGWKMVIAQEFGICSALAFLPTLIAGGLLHSAGKKLCQV